MAVPALLLEKTPLDAAALGRVARATLPVARSRQDAEDCAQEALLDILTKEMVPSEATLGLAIEISRRGAMNVHRKRRDHPQISVDAAGGLSSTVIKHEDPRTFFLWPGSEAHIDLLAIAEDDGERHQLGLEIAALQVRGETDYIGLHRSFREWDREAIIEALREFGERKGSVPIARDLQHDSLPTTAIISKYFQSWSAALEAAGFKPEKPIRRCSRWDRETARKAFCEWVTRHKRIPSKQDLAHETATMPSRITLGRLFGTQGAMRLSVEINRLCLDAGCRHGWQPGKPVKQPSYCL